MTDTVTVSGPHGRHMEIHPAIQKAFPDRFPLVEDKKTTVEKKATNDSESR
jgi:hypothetical protein